MRARRAASFIPETLHPRNRRRRSRRAGRCRRGCDIAAGRPSPASIRTPDRPRARIACDNSAGAPRETAACTGSRRRVVKRHGRRRSSSEALSKNRPASPSSRPRPAPTGRPTGPAASSRGTRMERGGDSLADGRGGMLGHEPMMHMVFLTAPLRIFERLGRWKCSRCSCMQWL